MDLSRGPLLLATVAALGLVVGSFLNVLIWRLPLKLSVVTPRSFCPSCERQLLWWELLPVFSYLALGGRCRTCQARISPAYPLVEAATAALFGASIYRWGPGGEALSVALFGCLLIVAGMVDSRHHIIPDAVTLPGMAAGLILSLVRTEVGLLGAGLGLLIGGGLLLGLAVITRGGMGGGDIKLAAMMGAFLGWESLLVALLLGFISGALVGGVMMLARRKGRKDLMAFGPFLAFGGLASAFAGPALIVWYLSFLLG